MLKLWLISFMLLFITAEGMQWFLQAQWFGDLALPLPVILLGGLGLAIASNRQRLHQIQPPPPSPPFTPSSVQEDKPSPDPAPTSASHQRQPKTGISFEIAKPQRSPQLPFETTRSQPRQPS